VARIEAEAALAEREELFEALAETLQAASQPDQLEHFSAQLAEFKRLDGAQRAPRCARPIWWTLCTAPSMRPANQPPVGG
jgi:hypothetical protein